MEERVFAGRADGVLLVLSHEQYLRLAGISWAASAAYDIMADDRVDPELAWRFALAAERRGEDPEKFARHFVRLRKFARSLDSGKKERARHL